jgi:hypothetical protein
MLPRLLSGRPSATSCRWSGMAVIVIVTSLGLAAGAADGAPPPPPASQSSYIAPQRIDAAFRRLMRQKGRALGLDVANGVYPYYRATVILDFGYQEKRNSDGDTDGCYLSPPTRECRWGAVLNNYVTKPWYPTSALRAVVLSYAQGFYFATTNRPEAFLTIVMGVSNGGHANYESGQNWANVAIDPSNAYLRSRGPTNFRWSRQIHVQGGCDCETGFGRAARL